MNDQKDDQQTDDLAQKIEEAKKEDAVQQEEEEVKEEVLSETDELKKQLTEMTEMAKRTMADMQNLKRRQEEERVQTIFRANATLIKDLLPQLDTMHKSLEHAPEGEQWTEGIKMSINQIQTTFDNAGLTAIEAMGKPFNPDIHEALAQGPGEKDIVLEELEKGYMLGEMVLRHTKVKVGNGEKTE